MAELGDPYILRDLRGISVVSYPIQYNPISKVLRVYNEIEVEIKSIGRDIVNILDRESLPNTRPLEFKNIYETKIHNYY